MTADDEGNKKSDIWKMYLAICIGGWGETDIYDAERGRSGICPICGEELIPRKGELREWHWGHKSGRKCDAWYDPT